MRIYFLILAFFIFFSGCSLKNSSLDSADLINAKIIKSSKREFDKISKDAVLEAIKKSFALSNKTKQFQINSYRNYILVQRINFDYLIFASNVKVENWLFELEQKDNKTYVTLSIFDENKFDDKIKRYYSSNYHELIWNRIEHLLGLDNKWINCKGYICSVFSSNKPLDKDYIKDVLISQRKAKLQAILNAKIEEKKKKIQEEILKEYEAYLDFEEKEQEKKKQDPQSIKIKEEFDDLLLLKDKKSLKKDRQVDKIDTKLEKINTN
ncbi:hypothetical protein AMRN_1591 [Malaciobacter marinus]|uniref:Lipoprotein n=1 Tax=Malaciobacter marinus TaxID=505249 RepID=A0A347TL47_9BACT|nr:hypothetical protein [Malaciobacter marinus]AXX87325.1 hypothetical protein AMRN_1591 [Malaciobacter marinus]PHO15194.1 hypothetical protein CPH92_07785 [Malaciobacter marinus]